MAAAKRKRRLETGNLPAHKKRHNSDDKIEGALQFMQSPGLAAWVAELTATQARNGVTIAAHRILADFIDTVNQCSPKSWQGPIRLCYARYLADAFQQILDGKDAALALGIKTSNPGRRRGKVTHDPDALGAGYYLLRLSGFSTSRAKNELHVETGADPSTIRKAINGIASFGELLFDELPAQGHRNFRREVARREAVNTTLELMAKPIAEKITRILARKGKQ